MCWWFGKVMKQLISSQRGKRNVHVTSVKIVWGSSLLSKHAMAVGICDVHQLWTVSMASLIHFTTRVLDKMCLENWASWKLSIAAWAQMSELQTRLMACQPSSSQGSQSNGNATRVKIISQTKNGLKNHKLKRAQPPGEAHSWFNPSSLSLSIKS